MPTSVVRTRRFTQESSTPILPAVSSKQRLRRKGAGKSGSFRTIILLRHSSIAIFVYGFAKSDRANISSTELEVWRRIAKDLLIGGAELNAALQQRRLIEVKCNEKEIS